MGNLNRVVLIGGLARDPELRKTPGGASVATLRLAFSTRRKVDGSWTDKPNYIDVEVWGGVAESAAKHLSKGRQIAVDGRLEWCDPANGKGGLDTHKLVAERLEFLPARRASRTTQGRRSAVTKPSDATVLSHGG